MKTVVIIAGPTASGKTSLSLSLAEHFKTAIISADSRQCFREMNIGVAKPDPGALERIPHYFINSHSITEEVNAAVFEQYALNVLPSLFERHDTVIMAGGTGLYIKAFCEGIDLIPAIPGEVRESISGFYRINGMEWLQEQVKNEDPQYYSTGETLNPQRLLRALEVKRFTGRSIREFQQHSKEERPFAIIRVALNPERSVLKKQIDQRIDKMLEAGLLEEVRSLMPYRDRNALKTVGYTELFEYIDGKVTFENAVEKIRSNTKAYAKRQLTWFKKDPDIKWFAEVNLASVLDFISRKGAK